MPKKTKAETVAETMTKRAGDILAKMVREHADAEIIDGRVARPMMAKKLLKKEPKTKSSFRLTAFGRKVGEVLVASSKAKKKPAKRKARKK